MMRDENFTVEELSAIAFGYTKLLEETGDVLTELKKDVYKRQPIYFAASS